VFHRKLQYARYRSVYLNLSELYMWDERAGVVQMKNRNIMYGISFQQ